MLGLIVFSGGIVTCFLAKPTRPSGFRNRTRNGIGVDHHAGILFGGHLIDEKIIVAAGNVVDRRESPIAQEQSFFVRQISAYTHVGDTGQGVREILQGGVKRFESDQFIE